MIMLAVASGRKVLNTQVDFLTKAAKGRLNQESLAAMISVEELQRKYTHAILEPPHYYITVSTNGKIPQLIQDYAQLLTDTQLKKMGSNKRVTVKISSKNMDLLRYKADQSFFKHLYKNVLGRYNAIKGLKVGDQARQPMKEFLEDLKQLAQNPNATTKFQAVDAKG